MTKYVINSGGINNTPDKGKRFFDEVFSNLGSNPKLLICLFAKPREDWETRYQESRDFFAEFFDNDTIPELTLAFPDMFADQVRNADAVYIQGGDDHLVRYWLRQFDLPRLWDGKVVATNSAGSNALVKHFWTCDWRQLMDGFGILPIKFISHFQSEYGADDPRGVIDWNKAYKELEEYGDVALPVYALKEGEYQVFKF